MPPLENEKNPNLGSIREPGLVRPPSVDQAAKLKEAVAHAKEKKLEDPMRPLKTYQSDVAEAIKKDNVSVIKIALAEKKRQEAQGLTKEAVSIDSKRSVLFFVLSAALVIAGIAIIGYFFFLRGTNQNNVLNLPKNLVYAEKNTELKLDIADPNILVNEVGKIKRLARPSGTIENLIVTEKDVGTSTSIELGARHLISGSRLTTLLNTRIPAPIFRSIQDIYMLGIYQTSNNSSEVFMILRSDSYEIAFAGMLEWEGTLQQDMTPLFSILQAPVITNSISTTTASSSTATTSNTTFTLSPLIRTSPTEPFKDRLIQNRDTRVITDSSGKIVFLYSFIDPHTVIFTQGEEAFKEIVGRYIQTGQEK